MSNGDIDEDILTAAKLGEQARGELDGAVDLHPHAGLVTDGDNRSVLSFLSDVDEWSTSSLRAAVEPALYTDELTQAIENGTREHLANFAGVTSSELTASEMRLLSQLSTQLENDGAPAFVSVAGNPETGKTNTVWLLAELRKELTDGDFLVISNAAGSLTDRRVTSMHDLVAVLIEERTTPKAVIIDEASTHMDARSYNYEVSHQWTPLAKRFAKLNVDFQANIVHSGKDYHPECKRLSTLAVWKYEKKVAEFFASWSGDADRPSDPIFAGEVADLEPTGVEYRPDDSAPWSWDFEPGLFEADRDWSGYLELLRERGPQLE